jgi:hypothetical protein
VRYPDPVVIVREPARDPFGDLAPGASPERIPAMGAYADGSASGRGGSAEDTLTRGATVTTQAQLYLPFGTDVLRTDQVEVRGRTWVVDGDPQHWESPLTGWRAGTVVSLRSVRG